MKIDEVILIAGGLGTRLRASVPDMPKVLAPVNGKSFLSFLLRFWLNKGIKKIIICAGYKSELVKNEVKFLGLEHLVDICYEEKLLGTGGAIFNGIKKIKQNYFIAQNGDTAIPIDLKDFNMNLMKIKTKTMIMTLIKKNNTSRYDTFSIEEDNILSKKDHPKKFINGGVYIFNKKKIMEKHYKQNLKISLEKQIIPQLIKDKEIIGNIISKPFLDIGIPVDYKKAKKFMSENFSA